MKFTAPVHLIQVFDNSYHYDKNHKSYAKRKEIVKWKNTIASNLYEIAEGCLLLNSAKVDSFGVNQPFNVLLAIDYNLHTAHDLEGLLRLNENRGKDIFSYPIRDRVSLKFGQIGKSPFRWEILMFKMIEAGILEVHFKWDYWKVGVPKRDDFQVAALRRGESVQIKTDGRSDTTLSWRKERTFIERDIIVAYLGTFTSVTYHKELPLKEKEIIQAKKVVDLMKFLK